MNKLLLTDREACARLGISRSKFHALVAEQRIPRLKIGRAARYRFLIDIDWVGATEEGINNFPGCRVQLVVPPHFRQMVGLNFE